MRMVSLVIACLVFIGFDKSIACDLGVQQVIAPLVVSPVIQQYSAVQFAQVQPVYAVQQVYAAPVVQQAVVQQRVVQKVVRQNIVQRVVVEQPVRRIKTVTIQKQRVGGLGLFR